MPSLVGSEMCIRDRSLTIADKQGNYTGSLTKRIFNVVFVDENKGFGIDASSKGKKVSYVGTKVELKLRQRWANNNVYSDSVSYTHLTLPTICSVQISVGAVSLKKKSITIPIMAKDV
eukprot:TRINITY_DN10789_c0_g1_i1.p3 TRINITY_DN10789_c0_g1~~TRINITY_DN10789_c0_g1_i1.p3  ORF type:complete len:118 (+),score=22.83 TRINITY_DN10789_c0_g1_i1:86-439(+)